MSINIAIHDNLFFLQEKEQSFSNEIHLTVSKLGVYTENSISLFFYKKAINKCALLADIHVNFTHTIIPL